MPGQNGGEKFSDYTLTANICHLFLDHTAGKKIPINGKQTFCHELASPARVFQLLWAHRTARHKSRADFLSFPL